MRIGKYKLTEQISENCADFMDIYI